MTNPALQPAIDAIYDSLAQGNVDLDQRIDDLKAALDGAGETQAVFAPARLVQNNRAGRKMMQSYFKKRGVSVVFAD